MFLKLTIYSKEPESSPSIMVNMGKVTYYADTYEWDIHFAKEQRRTIRNKTFTGCLIEFNNEKITVCETMEEINLKTAQLERRSNGNSNRKG